MNNSILQAKLLENREKMIRKLKIDALKKSRVRYHTFFESEKIISIYDPKLSNFQTRMYLFVFIAGMLLISAVFGFIMYDFIVFFSFFRQNILLIIFL